MGSTILLVHGRHWKPDQDDLTQLWIDALTHGLQRDFPDKVQTFQNATIEMIYYGDLSNAFLEKATGEARPQDTASRRATLEELKQYKANQFTKARYKQLPGYTPIKEFLTDVFGPPASFLHISEPLVGLVAPDMAHYWNQDSAFGSDVRDRMNTPLKDAMDRDDRIMVIAHSLGTLVSYDTFWKFSHYSEWKDYRTKKIDFWLTLGSPLADETVKRNLKGSTVNGPRRYPANIQSWFNVAAEDDYISHDSRVKNDYHDMIRFNLIESLEDSNKKIYNLAVRNGKSNPHSSVGYLVHPVVVETVARWLG